MGELITVKVTDYDYERNRREIWVQTNMGELMISKANFHRFLTTFEWWADSYIDQSEHQLYIAVKHLGDKYECTIYEYEKLLRLYLRTLLSKTNPTPLLGLLEEFLAWDEDDM